MPFQSPILTKMVKFTDYVQFRLDKEQEIIESNMFHKNKTRWSLSNS